MGLWALTVCWGITIVYLISTRKELQARVDYSGGVSPPSPKRRAEREQKRRMEEILGKRKWVILIAAILTMVVLISLFAVIPVVFGDNYVSVLVDLNFALGPGNPSIEVLYKDSILSVCFVTFDIIVTNSYFISVQAHYNGIKHAILIYNRIVSKPEDIETNKPFLIWGVFSARQLVNSATLSEKYDFYMNHRHLSNFTESILPGRSRYPDFAWSTGQWWGQSLDGKYVEPGTYYIYAIAYGKVSTPCNLTITSILY